jgi:hypothetical protein
VRPDSRARHRALASSRARTGPGPAPHSPRHALRHRGHAAGWMNALRGHDGRPSRHHRPAVPWAPPGAAPPLHGPPRPHRGPGFGAARLTALQRAGLTAGSRLRGSQSPAPPPGAHSHGTAGHYGIAPRHGIARNHGTVPRHETARNHGTVPRHETARNHGTVPRHETDQHHGTDRHAARRLLADVPASRPPQHHARGQTPSAPHLGARYRRRHAPHLSVHHQHAQSRRDPGARLNQSAPGLRPASASPSHPRPASASPSHPRNVVPRGPRHGAQASLPPRSPPPLPSRFPQPLSAARRLSRTRYFPRPRLPTGRRPTPDSTSANQSRAHSSEGRLR